ncbi:UNVERIFIED_CONTAM: hypothetical protein FKN15_057004 [Acipenser sinensis]
MDLKAQMAQVLELLSRQQEPAAPVEVPAQLPPAPAPVPGTPVGAQAEPESQSLMAEKDTLSIAASWGEDSLPIVYKCCAVSELIDYLCSVQAGPPCNYLRATVLEEHAALGRLQADP